MELSEAAKIIVWLQDAINEMDFELESTSIHQDGTCFIEWTTGVTGRYYKKREHIYVRHSCIMALEINGQIGPKPTQMAEMRADLLTNALLSGDLPRAITLAERFVR